MFVRANERSRIRTSMVCLYFQPRRGGGRPFQIKVWNGVPGFKRTTSEISDVPERICSADLG